MIIRRYGKYATVALCLIIACVVTATALTQPPRDGNQPPTGPGGFGPPGGGFFGGPGGPNQPEIKIVEKFDHNHDGWLNADERKEARQELATTPRRGPGGGRGGRGPMGGRVEPGKPGIAVAPSDVPTYPDTPLYDANVLRTLFLTFENQDWETELSDFHGTDADVPATLLVDGKEYPNVGVHFRGMSSYMMIPAGSKRSFNLSLDYVDQDQRLYGYKTLNLLNCHEDDSFLSTVLYSHIAAQYIPVPKANMVRVVVNGENWGIYCNVQQFDKVFLQEHFETEKGARWKVRGNPGADGGLRYLGDELAGYRQRFTIKSKDTEKSWNALVDLCRILNETPTDQLPAAIEPVMDVDEVLKFLALDVALVNNDGYWARASDYNLYADVDGKFQLIPHDMNEAMGSGPAGGPRGGGPGGPGMQGGRGRPNRNGPPNEGNRPADPPRPDGPPGFPPDGPPQGGPPQGGPPQGGMFGFGRGGPGGGGPGGMMHGDVNLDPLVGLDDARKPLRSKLLAVPAYRTKYLQYVRDIAEKSMDWNELGPLVAHYRELLQAEIERDSRKLGTYEGFLTATGLEKPKGREMYLKGFFETRKDVLLKKIAEAKP